MHVAALNFKETLKHQDVEKVKDKKGNTPLHVAAGFFKEVAKHPDANKVKNNYGKTPLQILRDLAPYKKI